MGKDQILSELESNRGYFLEKEFYAKFTPKATEIIQELEYYEGYYPESVIETILEGDEELITGLLALVEWSIENMEIVKSDADYMGCHLSFLILARLREKRAFPYLVSFFRNIEDFEFGHNEDYVWNYLSELLASCFDGSFEELNRIILKKETDVVIRCKFLDSYLIFYRENEISREELIAILRSFFQDIEREKSIIWECLLETCVTIFAEELLPEIGGIYIANLLNIGIYRYAEIITSISQRKVYQDCSLERNHKFDMDIKETLWWQEIDEFCGYTDKDLDSWSTKNIGMLKDIHLDEKKRERKKPAELNYKVISNDGLPYIRSSEKIGRNDPCPCGSGKKYKKCCGKNIINH